MKYHMLTDDMLLGHLKASDEKAFKEIYQRYWKLLFFIAYKKSQSKELAEEIVQSIFISVWEKRKTAEIDNLEHYLKVAVKYRVINLFKSRAVKEKFIRTVAKREDLDNSTYQSIGLKDLSDAMQVSIEMLPQKTKEIFKLSRLENYSVKQIAQQMNMSEKAVEYHITQSLKLMRTRLKDFMVLSGLAGWFLL
jgi:RNA polymerase sigma-70 factor (family 1)